MRQVVQKEIRKMDGKYYVYSSKGKRISRGYGSRKEALKRMGQIEYFKSHKADNSLLNDLNEE